MWLVFATCAAQQRCLLDSDLRMPSLAAPHWRPRRLTALRERPLLPTALARGGPRQAPCCGSQPALGAALVELVISACQRPIRGRVSCLSRAAPGLSPPGAGLLRVSTAPEVSGVERFRGRLGHSPAGLMPPASVRAVPRCWRRARVPTGHPRASANVEQTLMRSCGMKKADLALTVAHSGRCTVTCPHHMLKFLPP